MRDRLSSLLCTVLFTCTAAHAADCTFRGLKFGVDLRTQIPECERNGRPGSVIHYQFDGQPRTCWMFDPPTTRRPDDDGPTGVFFVDSGALPRSLRMMNVHSMNGKLAALAIGFYAGEFSVLEQTFRAKYGKPAESRDVPWQSKGGVVTVSHQREWHHCDLRLILDSPHLELDNGFIQVATAAYLEAEHRQNADRVKKAAGDL